MAGLYELWRDPGRPPEDPGAWLCSATIITTRAFDELGHRHDRMPMFVEPACYAAWLDLRRTDPTAARALLVPAAPGRLEPHPVSRAVGDVANNGPQLATPLSTSRWRRYRTNDSHRSTQVVAERNDAGG
jgi:putative SOS response-associated peptidase YedK